MNNNIYLNTPHKNKFSFKGHSAASLKALYLQSSTSNFRFYGKVLEAATELSSIGKKEGFDVFIHSNGVLYNRTQSRKRPPIFEQSSIWMQDCNIILPNNKLGILMENDYGRIVESNNLSSAIKKDSKKIFFKIQGGNSFTGKKNNGEHYILIGDNSIIANELGSAKFIQKWENADVEQKRVLSQKAREQLAQETGIKASNIYFAPQSKTNKMGAVDFHIDMVVRPLEYPYILVNDPKLVISEYKKRVTNAEQSEFILENLEREQNNFVIAPAEKLVQELSEQGFKPIRVPGVFWRKTTNFMNSIVHKRQDGGLVYITNHSYAYDDMDYNKIFRDYIKKNVPEIKKIFFVKNHLLEEGTGGIHCMTMEEPVMDFN